MSTQNQRGRRGQVKLNASHIAGYAAAAGASALVGTAEASITYVSVNTAVLDTTLNGSATGVDLLFGAAPTHLALLHGIGTTNAATGYAFTAPTAGGTPGAEVAGFSLGSFNYVQKVTAGANISTLPSFLTAAQAGTMAFNAGYTNSQFLAAGNAFLGVRFNTNQYGWVRVTMNGAPLNSFTIVDYAYAGPGEAITAGQVPTPGCLGALALGSVGVAGWRRRRSVA